MPRTLTSFALIFVLVLAIGGSALAAPMENCEPGLYFAFGEVGSSGGIAIGSGYGISGNLTVGAQIQYIENGWYLGGFVNYAIKPFVISGDCWWTFSGLTVRASGIYLLDVDQFDAGIGIGILMDGGSFSVFIEGVGGVPVAKNFTIYGACDYFPSGGDLACRFGVAYVF